MLRGSEAHHLRNVLRAKLGRVVELMDGSGRVWRAVVGECSESGVDLFGVELLETTSAASQLGLIQSLCRADKLEWVLEKCTEIGIDDIYLLEAARSIVRIPRERLDTKMNRWQKIIVAAAKQSRRSTLPVLHPPSSLSLFCGKLPPGLKILLSENEHDTSLRSILRSASWQRAIYCIGPEGGWTEAEHRELVGSGFQPASLGSQILRTETAALVVAAILKYERDGS